MVAEPALSATWEARRTPALPTAGLSRVGTGNDKKPAPKGRRDSDRFIVARNKVSTAPILAKEPTSQCSLQRKLRAHGDRLFRLYSVPTAIKKGENEYESSGV